MLKAKGKSRSGGIILAFSLQPSAFYPKRRGGNQLAVGLPIIFPPLHPAIIVPLFLAGAGAISGLLDCRAGPRNRADRCPDYRVDLRSRAGRSPRERCAPQVLRSLNGFLF